MTAAAPRWPAPDTAAFVGELLGWLEAAGATRYDETVTQLEHALQCAHLAVRANASECAIAAALLHDVGHLLVAEHGARADFLAADMMHEAVGARWLAMMFPPQLSETVRLHVSAKRYLCTVDPAYRERLSAASRRSFALQGGALCGEALAALEHEPALAKAIALRRRDDAAKVAGRPVPALASYRPLLEALIRR